MCRENARWGNVAAALSLLALLMLFRNEHYTLLMMATVAIFATACIGLNVQMAFAGVPNFAGAAFFTIGAYTAAVLAQVALLPHVLILLISGMAAGLIGLLLLFPVLRTRGHYAALATIAFGLLLRSFFEVNDVLGGPQGMKLPSFTMFGLDFGNIWSIGGVEVSFYLPYAIIAALLFAMAFMLARRLENSLAGVAIDAVRTDEIAASVFGLSIRRWKTLCFVFGNVMIGVAGGLYGMMNGFVNPNSAGFTESLAMLSIIVLGGIGNFWGAVAGAVIIVALPEKLQSIQEYRLLIFALLVIVILRFHPSGILPRATRNLSTRRQPAERP